MRCRTAGSFPWKAASKGKTAVLDDYRESIGLALLRDNDRSAINSSDPLLINQARDALLDLDKLVGLRIDNDTAAQLASGQTWIHHAWSGQVVAAAKKLPPDVPIGVLGYWFPPEGAGPVANDTNTILRGAQNPVLAHLFLNFMLARNNALHNIAATGFTQPLTYATPSPAGLPRHPAVEPDLGRRAVHVPRPRPEGAAGPARPWTCCGGRRGARSRSMRDVRRTFLASTYLLRMQTAASRDRPVISKALSVRTIRSNQE